MELHISDCVEQVGFWAMDEVKVRWDDNTCKFNIIKNVIRKSL